MAPFCTAGKVHVGLDESFTSGGTRSAGPRSPRWAWRGHFAALRHRLHGLAGARGLRLGMWADMLALLPEAIPQLPPGITAYDWYYYPFAGAADRAAQFRRVRPGAAAAGAGIEYWGCPMNGAFRHEPLPVFGDRLANIRAWWRRCRPRGGRGCWSPPGSLPAGARNHRVSTPPRPACGSTPAWTMPSGHAGPRPWERVFKSQDRPGPARALSWRRTPMPSLAMPAGRSTTGDVFCCRGMNRSRPYQVKTAVL